MLKRAGDYQELQKLKLTNRVIRLYGDIDEINLTSFSEELQELESENYDPILVELCSGGGDTYIGLAFYAKITESPCAMTVLAVGQVMSAATAVLAAGDVRLMHKDCWYMIHDDEGAVKHHTPATAIQIATHRENVEHHWAELISRNCKETQKNLRALSKTTTYLTPEDCFNLGLIDEIVGNK